MSQPAAYGRAVCTLSKDSHTLIHNWYEERLADVQPSTQDKRLREVETGLAVISEDRYNVLDRIARALQTKSTVVADDGYTIRCSVTKADFRDPKDVSSFVQNPPKKPVFVTTETISEVSYDKRRPLEGEQRGFGSVLDRHDPTMEGIRYFESTNRDDFGYPAKEEIKSKVPSDFLAAGVSVTYMAERPEGMKVSDLVGEQFKPDSDPGENTNVQRTWMGRRDPALKALRERLAKGITSGKPVLPAKNNEMSVPIGEGEHKTIAAKLASRSMLYLETTEITTGSDSKYGVSVWRDVR